MKSIKSYWICDGCLNISKKQSCCPHSFCDGTPLELIPVREYVKVTQINKNQKQIIEILKDKLIGAEFCEDCIDAWATGYTICGDCAQE